MRSKNLVSTTIVLTLFFASFNLVTTRAEIVLRPPGLNPSDQYRLVFLMDEATLPNGQGSGLHRPADSPDIATYDSRIAQAVAHSALASVPTTWQAMASVAGLDARDHTHTNPNVDGAGVPLYNLYGELVAIDYADLWDGEIAKPIDVTQHDRRLTHFTWTGTNSDGTGAIFNTLGTDRPQYGFNLHTNNLWINQGIFDNADGGLALYGISGVLTVPFVPEPSTWLLGAIASIGMMLRRKRSPSSKLNVNAGLGRSDLRLSQVAADKSNGELLGSRGH